MAVSRRLKPSVVGVAIDFLFEGVEDSDPRIGSKSSCAHRRHKEPSWRDSKQRAFLKLRYKNYVFRAASKTEKLSRELSRTPEQMGILAQNFSRCGKLPTKFFLCTVSFSNLHKPSVK